MHFMNGMILIKGKEVEINYERLHKEICTLTKDIYAPVKPPLKFT